MTPTYRDGRDHHEVQKSPNKGMTEITSSLLVINLDFRIFCLTIMLSVVLLSIAVMEYLVSFKIIDI